MRFLPLAILAAAVPAAELAPEVHGFVSFGAVSTPGVNWIGDTHGGSTDFYEAALSATIQPLPDLRLGAQVFTRNFLGDDAGRVSLDWANADWRPDDRFGLAVGRVKIPIGLYNESLDIDAARTQVFLSKSIYSLNARDLFISLDGGRLYGLLPLGAANEVEYSLQAGHTPLEVNGGFAAYLTKSGLGDEIQRLQTRATFSGMLHWRTPVAGLGARLTYSILRELEVSGYFPASGVTLESSVPIYHYLVASLLWEHGPWTVSAEAERTHGVYDFASFSGGSPLGTSSSQDNHAGGYVSANYAATPRLDLYAAIEHQYDDIIAPQSTETSLVFAARFDITPHWLVKGEFQNVRGNNSLSQHDNPGEELPNAWQIYALKTTVDF